MLNKFEQISLKPGFMKHNGGLLFRNVTEYEYEFNPASICNGGECTINECCDKQGFCLNQGALNVDEDGDYNNDCQRENRIGIKGCGNAESNGVRVTELNPSVNTFSNNDYIYYDDLDTGNIQLNCPIGEYIAVEILMGRDRHGNQNHSCEFSCTV